MNCACATRVIVGMVCKLYENEVCTPPTIKLLSMLFKAPCIRKTLLKQSYFVDRKFWKLSYSQIFCAKLHAVGPLEFFLSASNDCNINSACNENKTFTVLNYSQVCNSCFWLLKRSRWNRPVFLNSNSFFFSF